MFLTSRVTPRPMFPTGSRLAVVRDVAVLAVCIGIIAGFLLEVWSVPRPRTPIVPASAVASIIALR